MACKLIIWLVTFLILVCEALIKTSQFAKAPLCDVNTRLTKGCMRQSPRPGNRVQCCARCSTDDNCTGASVDRTGNGCYLHTSCPAVTGCTVKDTELQHFQKKPKSSPQPLACVNGNLDKSSGRCICQIQWSGELCERRAYHCADFRAYHDTILNGLPEYWISVIMISPDQSRQPTPICVRRDKELWTVLFQNVGETDLNRSWNMYTQGIFNGLVAPNTSFWIGLEDMRYLLDSASVKDLGFSVEFTNTNFNFRYGSPTIGDISTYYRLQLSATLSNGSAVNHSPDDCLLLSNMTSFSTPDSVHDDDVTRACVSQTGAGWWFPSCNSKCNPAGKFYSWSPAPASPAAYVAIPGQDSQYIKTSLQAIRMFMVEY